MRQRSQADALARQNGLGERISYHRIYRVVPFFLIPLGIPLLVLVVALCATVLRTKYGWWPPVLAAILVIAVPVYILWPIRLGVRGVGVYANGLLLLGTPRPVAITWPQLSRVTYRKSRARSSSEYAMSMTRTVEVQYAFSQLWLRGETAPITLVHVRRHKRMLKKIQAVTGS